MVGEFDLGSIAATVQDLIESIPTAISGTRLLEIANRQVAFVESFTGASIGSKGIVLKYQGALVDLTCAEVLSLMNTIGADVNSISLGDFSESKGGETNLMVASKNFEERGMKKLNTIGSKISVYKAFG